LKGLLVHDLFTYLENDSQFPMTHVEPFSLAALFQILVYTTSGPYVAQVPSDICFYAYLCIKKTSVNLTAPCASIVLLSCFKRVYTQISFWFGFSKASTVLLNWHASLLFLNLFCNRSLLDGCLIRLMDSGAMHISHRSRAQQNWSYWFWFVHATNCRSNELGSLWFTSSRV
jgi:hypothetical protein